MVQIAPLRQELPFGVEDLNPVILTIADQNASVPVDPYSMRRGELTRTGSRAAHERINRWSASKQWTTEFAYPSAT